MERNRNRDESEPIKIKFVESLDNLSEIESEIMETSELDQNLTYDAIFIRDKKIHGKLFNATTRQLTTGIMELGDLGYDIYVKEHKII